MKEVFLLGLICAVDPSGRMRKTRSNIRMHVVSAVSYQSLARIRAYALISTLWQNQRKNLHYIIADQLSGFVITFSRDHVNLDLSEVKKCKCSLENIHM